MKKLFSTVLALALLCSLAACGDLAPLLPGTALPDATAEPGADDEAAFEPVSLYEFLGWDDFAAGYYDNTPVALTYTYNGEASGDPAPVFDRATIIAACDALRGMTVTGESDTVAADDEAVYTFTMADGETYTVCFSGNCVDMNRGDFTVTGLEALDSLSFPGYGGSFDVFSLYYSDAVSAFARDFDQNTPVSVSRRENAGAALTSDDPATVRAVFDALRGAQVSHAERSPDQNIDLTRITDYIFTLPDGSEQVFTFTAQCLTVTASEVYGPVYFWLDGIDPLWDISVLPDDDTAAFSGGSITELRTDLQGLRDILDGTDADLSVRGVYVDYAVNGETGYVTLDENDAPDFLRTVLAVTSSGERVASPEGESITISVTLSDESGPILYFTGNAVQQVVGEWFSCDASAMDSLRAVIAELAETKATQTTDARTADAGTSESETSAEG